MFLELKISYPIWLVSKALTHEVIMKIAKSNRWEIGWEIGLAMTKMTD